MSDENTTLNPVELATDLTIAWLGNANTRASAEDVPAFLTRMHEAIRALSTSSAAPAEQDNQKPPQEFTPAVTARKSLANPDFIISMIDGKPYKSLTRHIRSNGLTTDEYKERYGLKKDYPLVAPNYAEARRQIAKKLGLGRKPGEKPTRGKAKVTA